MSANDFLFGFDDLALIVTIRRDRRTYFNPSIGVGAIFFGKTENCSHVSQSEKSKIPTLAVAL